jgi:GT2 family glycosyltransferase
MRFTYEKLESPIHLFYTSCAAIKKEIFLKTKGFDVNYTRPSIEDTVFGAELGSLGVYIVANPKIEVEHVKHYSLISIFKTDFIRSSDLTKFVLRSHYQKRSKRVNKTSVPNNFILSTFFMALFLGTLAVLCIFPYDIFFKIGASFWGIVYILNWAWLSYLFKQKGLVFLFKSFLFLPVDLSVVILGVLKGVMDYIRGIFY